MGNESYRLRGNQAKPVKLILLACTDHTDALVWICEGCRQALCKRCEPPASDDPLLCEACQAVGMALGLT